MGLTRETALASSTLFVFQMENANIHEVVMHSGMHSGLCEQYIKYLGLSASGFDFLFRTRPRTLW